MYNKLKEKVKNFFLDIWKNKIKKITFLMYVFLPIAINIVVEALNQRSAGRFFKFFFTSLDVFLINLFIIYAVFSVCLLFKKRIPFMLLLFGLWIGFGIANYIVRSTRETPLNFTDLKGFAQIADVFDKYMSTFQIVLVISAIIAALALVAVLLIKMPSYAPKLNYIRNIIIIAFSWALMFASINIGQAADRVSVKFPNMTIAYQSFGFTYCFTYGMVSVGVDKPAEYTDKDIAAIAEKIENTVTVDKDNVSTPNIIFLQLESFIDLNTVPGIVLNTEATPNFTGLKEEYPSGYLSVNNVGYGTANTEFEIMTGMNLEDFGPGEFPYKTVLKSTVCESICYVLRDYGYMSHAMHNNTGTFYSRNVVFRNLGFDTYTSLEYMIPTEYTPKGWVKDKILTDEIIKVLDSTEEQDYIYAISVQGHGAYPSEPMIEDPYIQVKSGVEDEERRNQISYYANQIYEMDKFIGELTDALSQYKEEVILVMYGDHLPGMGFGEEDLLSGDLYKTEYIVWSNYGFDMESGDIETYQLASRLLQNLNMDNGIINKFHQVYEDDSDYLKFLQKLEYDILYGDRYVYGGASPYVATDLQMGTYRVEISDIYFQNPLNPVKVPEPEYEYTNSGSSPEIGENEDFIEGWIVVKGKYFTPYSKVFINDEKHDTVFVDENTLLVYDPDLKTLDEFTIKQMWKEKTVVSVSESSMYVAPVEPEEKETTAGEV